MNVKAIIITGMFALGLNAISQEATAQEIERQYKRKSLTSLGSAVLAPNVRADIKVIANRLEASLRLPRFDHNKLSEESMAAFKKMVNQTNFSPKEITDVLNQTVLKDLKTSLEIVAIERAKKNLQEEDAATAAVDKMKTSGITGEDLQTVMNTAYLYLPVITDYQETIERRKVITAQDVVNLFTKDKKKKSDRAEREEAKYVDVVNVRIAGYLLWYRMNISKTGEATIIAMPGLSAIQSGGAEIEDGYSYPIKKREVDAKLYAKLIAANTWARNIVSLLKSEPEFKLVAEITETNPPLIAAKIGRSQGAGLDDGFNLIEYEETSDGRTVANEVGFYRIISLPEVKRGSDPYGLSTLDQGNSIFYGYIVGNPERGMLVQERPRLPFDISFGARASFTTHFEKNIPKSFSDFKSKSPEYTSALNQSDLIYWMGLNAGINLNLAKFVGISQLFVLIDAEATFSLNTTATNVFGWTAGGYLGMMKKFWAGLFNINLTLAAGAEYLSITSSNAKASEFEKYGSAMISLKVALGLEFMLNPDVMLSINGGAKYRFTPIVNSISYKGVAESLSPVKEGMPMGVENANFFAGISLTFSLQTLPFDPFPAFSAAEIVY